MHDVLKKMEPTVALWKQGGKLTMDTEEVHFMLVVLSSEKDNKKERKLNVRPMPLSFLRQLLNISKQRRLSEKSR